MSLIQPRKLVTIALAATSLGALGLSTSAGVALADGGGTTPFIQHWSAFSGGKVGGYTVGDPIVVNYKDPSGATSEQQFCWSPAPLGRPACSSSNTGAPAQQGLQTVTAMLNDGQQVSTQFDVGPANQNLGTGTGPFTNPVPMTVNGSAVLSGDARLSQVIGQLSVGQQVAAYSSPRPGVTQVYDYATGQAGFFPSVLLTAPTPSYQTITRTVRLKSNRTATYRMSLPSGFKPGSPQPGATSVDYALYRGDAIGTGVGNGISAKGNGPHSPFLGAQVTRTVYDSSGVVVHVKTGKLSGPVTLRIAANGTL